MIFGTSSLLLGRLEGLAGTPTSQDRRRVCLAETSAAFANFRGTVLGHPSLTPGELPADTVLARFLRGRQPNALSPEQVHALEQGVGKQLSSRGAGRVPQARDVGQIGLRLFRREHPGASPGHLLRHGPAAASSHLM
jgi:hypothetical protein